MNRKEQQAEVFWHTTCVSEPLCWTPAPWVIVDDSVMCVTWHWFDSRKGISFSVLFSPGGSLMCVLGFLSLGEEKLGFFKLPGTDWAWKAFWMSVGIIHLSSWDVVNVKMKKAGARHQSSGGVEAGQKGKEYFESSTFRVGSWVPGALCYRGGKLRIRTLVP